MSWTESVSIVDQAVKEMVAGKKPKVKLSTVTEALTGWTETDLCEYTEGAYEALARRVVWVFESGYTITIGTDITTTISHIDEELTEESPMPFPESIEESNWSFNPSANAWQRSENLTTEELIEFLDNIANEVGETPKLVLPLEYKFEQDFEDMAEYDDAGTWEAMGKLALIFSEPESLKALQSIVPWELELTDEEGYLPYYCDWSKFSRFTNFLEETGKWMVILDEHCAACSSGSRSAEISANPALKDAPVFMTWGQNSQGAYMPDGTMWAEVYVDEAEDERFLKRNARTFGLNIGEWEGEAFEASGNVTFGD